MRIIESIINHQSSSLIEIIAIIVFDLGHTDTIPFTISNQFIGLSLSVSINYHYHYHCHYHNKSSTMGELHKRSKHSSSSVDPPEHEHLLNVNLSDAPYDEPASSHSSMDLCSNKPSYKPSHKPLVTKKISDMNKKKKTSSSNCFSRRGILCATMFLLMATALVMFPDSSSSFGDFMLPTSVDMDLRKEMGYVVSIHGSNTHELCGALMLAWTLRDRDPGHDLLAVISGELSSQEEYSFTREVLQKVGYNITEGKDLLNPQSNDPIDKYIYSHLNVVRTYVRVFYFILFLSLMPL